MGNPLLLYSERILNKYSVPCSNVKGSPGVLSIWSAALSTVPMVVKSSGALLVEVSQRVQASGFDFLALYPVPSLVPDP